MPTGHFYIRSRPFGFKSGLIQKRTIACATVRLVPLTGLEPVRSFPHWILSPTRLPIPPQRRVIFFVRLWACSLSVKIKTLRIEHSVAFFWRHHPDLNRGLGLCRPLPYRLAMVPYHILYDSGGNNRTRTYDPLLVRQMLSRLS